MADVLIAVPPARVASSAPSPSAPVIVNFVLLTALLELLLHLAVDLAHGQEAAIVLALALLYLIASTIERQAV